VNHLGRTTKISLVCQCFEIVHLAQCNIHKCF
jgi:hypothetical protein